MQLANYMFRRLHVIQAAALALRQQVGLLSVVGVKGGIWKVRFRLFRQTILKNPGTFRPLNSFFHPLASQFFDLDSVEVHLSGPGYALGQADSWLHGCTVAHSCAQLLQCCCIELKDVWSIDRASVGISCQCSINSSPKYHG